MKLSALTLTALLVASNAAQEIQADTQSSWHDSITAAVRSFSSSISEVLEPRAVKLRRLAREDALAAAQQQANNAIRSVEVLEAEYIQEFKRVPQGWKSIVSSATSFANSVARSAESLASTAANPYTSEAASIVSSAESLASMAANSGLSIATSVVSSAESLAAPAADSATREASSIVSSALSVASTAGGAQRSSAMSVASNAVSSANSVASKARAAATSAANSANSVASTAASQATQSGNVGGKGIGKNGMGVFAGFLAAVLGVL